MRHALPGERVHAVITDGSSTSTFWRADAVEVLDASPDRVEPPCPWAGPGRCGGCDFQHVAPAAQRALKAAVVREQLERLGGIDRDVEVEEVPGAPGGLGWRTRMQYAVDAAGRAGLRRHRSSEVVPIDWCRIAHPLVVGTGVSGLRWPGVSSVQVSAALDPPAALVLPDGRGPGALTEVVRDRSFRVTGGGFWQVHPGAAEVLAQAVLDGLDPQPGESALDLYAGVGLFAALLGERVGAAGAVQAVESDPRACADAARNTADLPHVRIRTAAVDVALLGRVGRPDLVVLDPPRAGAGLAVTRALAAMRPRRMAYVACDPASFARDLRVLLDVGWELESLRGFDLFPMTEHVELVAVLAPPGF